MQEGTIKTWLELPVSIKEKLLAICKEQSITQKQFFIEAVEKEYTKLKK
jgi:hypothetical protein